MCPATRSLCPGNDRPTDCAACRRRGDPRQAKPGLQSVTEAPARADQLHLITPANCAHSVRATGLDHPAVTALGGDAPLSKRQVVLAQLNARTSMAGRIGAAFPWDKVRSELADLLKAVNRSR